MATATFNNKVIARSEHTVTIEGNVYFPPGDVDERFISPSPTTSRCYWKGRASYVDVTVDGQTATDAGWRYERPWPLARRITNYVAFWNGVEVTAD